MTHWYTRTTCLECRTELTTANIMLTRVCGKLYPRGICYPCHRELSKISMQRKRDRDKQVKPTQSSYPQYRRWLAEMAREVKQATSRK